jgi:hypothetical protein
MARAVNDSRTLFLDIYGFLFACKGTIKRVENQENLEFFRARVPSAKPEVRLSFSFCPFHPRFWDEPRMRFLRFFMDECVGNTGKCSTFAAQSDDLRFFYCSISLLNWYLEREERAELISVEAVPSGAVFTIGY